MLTQKRIHDKQWRKELKRRKKKSIKLRSKRSTRHFRNRKENERRSMDWI